MLKKLKDLIDRFFPGPNYAACAIELGLSPKEVEDCYNGKGSLETMKRLLDALYDYIRRLISQERAHQGSSEQKNLEASLEIVIRYQGELKLRISLQKRRQKSRDDGPGM